MRLAALHLDWWDKKNRKETADGDPEIYFNMAVLLVFFFLSKKWTLSVYGFPRKILKTIKEPYFLSTNDGH